MYFLDRFIVAKLLLNCQVRAFMFTNWHYWTAFIIYFGRGKYFKADIYLMFTMHTKHTKMRIDISLSYITSPCFLYCHLGNCLIVATEIRMEDTFYFSKWMEVKILLESNQVLLCGGWKPIFFHLKIKKTGKFSFNNWLINWFVFYVFLSGIFQSFNSINHY